jgi:hypothetical protein
VSRIGSKVKNHRQTDTKREQTPCKHAEKTLRNALNIS